MISVNKEQTKKIGEIVKTLEFRPSFYERDFIQIDSPLKMAMHFYAVGICHQTYVLANPKLNLFGWDFMEYGFLDMLINAPNLLIASELVKLSNQELIEKIKPFFAEDHLPEKCTLDTLEERAHLWLNMAQGLVMHFDGKIENLFLQSDWQKTQNAESLYKLLRVFEAYSDPLQKKSGVFLKLIADANLVNLDQLTHVIPIMDYHMQRVLLRTGCVEVNDKSLKEKLQNRKPISNDEPLRKACIEAMDIIAKTAHYHPFKMNDVFYTLGRSCCNEATLCRTHSCEKSPCTLTRAVYLETHESCIFQEICKGATDDDYHQYWQPQIQTHFY
ncbi:MAG: hypothetical protein JW857_03360 [Bacteroidales bacterium]|nr:hypothetical protein [Bacteroidales bacterium]